MNDVLYNFISPVTGRLPLTENYILLGGRQGFSVMSPKLIDIELELININHILGDLSASAFILGAPNPKLPLSQDLSSLDNGFMFNTAGTISTTNNLPLPSLPYNNIWVGNINNVAVPTPYVASQNNSSFILQTPNPNLPNSQALGLLLGGILQSAPLTGVVSIAIPDVDYATVATLEELAAEAEASAEAAAASATEAAASAAEASASAAEATGAAAEASFSALEASLSAIEAGLSATEASAAAAEATASAAAAAISATEAAGSATAAALSATEAATSATAAATSATAAETSATAAAASATDASGSAGAASGYSVAAAASASGAAASAVDASSSASEAQDYLNTLLSTGLNALPCTGNVSFQGYTLINLGTPINPTDGATKGYVDTAIGNVPLASLTLQGDVTGSGPLNVPVITTLTKTLNEITNAGNVNIADFLLNNVLDPINPQDGATKNYVDTSTIAPSRIIGYPSNSSLFLNGAGSWTAPSFSNLITTNSLSYELTINNTNASSTDTGLLVKNNGINAVGFGFNNSTNEAYVWAYGNALLKFGTNATTRMQLLNNGTLDLLTNSLTTTGNINAGTINVLNSLVMGNNSITGLANPVNPTDGANKQYVDSIIAPTQLISLSGAISGSGQTGTVVNTILSSLIGLTTNQVFNFTGSPTSFNYDLTIPNSTNQTVKLRLNRANTGNGAGYEFQFYSPINGVDTFTFGYNSGSVFGNIYTIANNVPVINYTYSLNVSDNGAYKPYNGSYGYLSSNGSTGQATGQNSYSINCTNRVKASEFDAVSSKKLKTILGKGDEIEHTAIELFKKIPLFKYKYKDTIKEGNADHYGVIAEELAEVIPAFVNMQDEGWIPNIYKNCIAEKGLDNSYKLYFDEKLENIEGRKLKLIFQDKEGEKNVEVDIISIIDNEIIVDSKEELKTDVFAYGTYSLCPTVSKQKVFELGLVALQNIIKRVESLENKLRCA